jgi:hypothetical protein
MPLSLNLSALAVATLYYAWRDAYAARKRCKQILCERVAFMLWTAANQVV